MSESTESPNLFFRLVIAAGTVFVVTIFALLVLPFGNSQSPVSRFLNQYGGIMIAIEVGATLVFAFLAMVIDRRHTPMKTGNDAIHKESPTVSDETSDLQT